MNRISRLALFILVVASVSQARVISYAPYTDRAASPAVQSRLNRHFVLIEQGSSSNLPIGSPLPPQGVSPPGQVVLYDSKGLDEPRVIFPADGSSVGINVAAAREDERQVLSVLIQTTANFNGANPTFQPIWLFTNDSGATWIKVAIPSTANVILPFAPDTGGPFIRSRYSSLRVGTREVPFVVAASTSSPQSIYGVTSGGSVRLLYTSDNLYGSPLIGSDREGRRFLVRDKTSIDIVDVDGHSSDAQTITVTGTIEGWITPSGGIYLEHVQNVGQVVLYYAKDGAINPVAASWDGPVNVQPPINGSWIFFAVPTADYSGAWILKRGGGRPSTLLLHTPSFGLVQQWQDVSAPEVEALHAATSGSRVLIQVHRPRQSVDNLLFKDPALAVWHVGDPAPKSYDELFLSETTTKGFVHVDVDAIESGEPFVFDSGTAQTFFPPGPILSPAPPSGGGSDVVQEWGVVRASLAQKLVLPGVGRTQGAYGSNWSTDVTFYNPSDSPLSVSVLFLRNGLSRLLPILGAPGTFPTVLLTLQPREIRAIPDVVASLFGLENANGALYISPNVGGGVNVTSRTYNTSSNGTYGFTMNGIDVFSAAGPRFPLTFSGAFEGLNFRTNVMVADVSGRGSEVNATALGPNGSMATEAVSFEAPASGQIQINSIGPSLGVGATDTGALLIQPSRGETIASVFVVDNRTNDPTFFPPDIPASVMRVIPAIGHLDGANGSKFRSDLFLYNNSSQPKTLTLQAKLWDVPENPSTLPLTLLPHEARVIRDVLLTAFSKVGIARLRFTSQTGTTDTSVRVTSRMYTIDPSGGTYGFLMPPLNSFQSGGPGDTLEILGASLDPRFRTNLGLVDLTGFPGPQAARAKVEIIDDAGRSLDNFEVSIPSAGGMQINDLFHGRGLAESNKPVLIRVSTIQGMIGAYAAFVDNGTNDPAYVAANLAAKN
ncbi:MAG TPA: hypothetical protein VII12_17850 [Thermoanaerobaculia bacterium]